VARDIKIVNADILLRRATIVEGSILVKRRHDHRERRERLEIRVTEGSVVRGDIVVRDPDVDVAVYLADGGAVQGQVEGATVLRQ
jgi:hypothetical protein